MERAAHRGALAVMPRKTMGLRPRTVPAPGGPLVVFESDDVDRDLNDAIARGAPAPYGRVLWPSAHAAASALLAALRTQRTDQSGVPTVLELGCGTGLCSLVAARAGATVLATDVDDGALSAVRAATMQFPGARLATSLFDVRSSAPLPAADIVIAADLLYEELLAAAMARRTAEALERGSIVIVGDPGRVFRGRFDSLLAARGTTPVWRAGSKDSANDSVVVAVLP